MVVDVDGGNSPADDDDVDVVAALAAVAALGVVVYLLEIMFVSANFAWGIILNVIMIVIMHMFWYKLKMLEEKHYIKWLFKNNKKNSNSKLAINLCISM